MPCEMVNESFITKRGRSDIEITRNEVARRLSKHLADYKLLGFLT